MGLIKKILGGLFSFIGGLFKGILKIFGIGKSEFYMELDDAAAAVNSAAASATAAVEAATPDSTPVGKADKAKVAPAGQNAPAPKPELKPEPTPTLAKGELPVATAVANGSAGSEPTFATDYLLTPQLNNSGRRRPGPSLSPFKEMAKQVNTPVA
ncbi:MAG: hypothetical protein AAGF66_16180 [Cyanobacteria bacterium P01_H01_bin.119]